MTQIIIENPDLYTTKEVDSSGRVYLGKDWANKEVKVAIEEVVDEGNAARMKPETAD